jgi:hypothetical protein
MRCAPRPTRERLRWRPAGRRPGGLAAWRRRYPRLSDAGLVKLFRLLRLARRLLDLETGAASSNPGHGA